MPLMFQNDSAVTLSNPFSNFFNFLGVVFPQSDKRIIHWHKRPFEDGEDDDIDVDKSNDWQEPKGRPGNKACWHAGADLALFVQKVAASFPR